MALDFDGTDDFLESSTLPIASATYPITMACWFNVDNTTASHTLIALDSNGGSRRVMMQADGATAGDPVVAYAFDSAGNQAGSATGFSAGSWHHGVAIFSANNARYAGIDGTLGSVQSTTRSASWNRFKLGARTSAGANGSFCNGRIAEAGVWNAVLDAAEIAALAKGIPPRFVRPSSLVFYAPMVRDFLDHRNGIVLTENGGGLAIATHCRRIG